MLTEPDSDRANPPQSTILSEQFWAVQQQQSGLIRSQTEEVDLKIDNVEHVPLQDPKIMKQDLPIYET